MDMEPINQLSIFGALRAMSTPKRGSFIKLLSFGSRGLATLFKKLATRKFVESNQPDLILLQQTLREGFAIVNILSTGTSFKVKELDFYRS